jgi:hypothetical protein
MYSPPNVEIVLPYSKNVALHINNKKLEKIAMIK